METGTAEGSDAKSKRSGVPQGMLRATQTPPGALKFTQGSVQVLCVRCGMVAGGVGVGIAPQWHNKSSG